MDPAFYQVFPFASQKEFMFEASHEQSDLALDLALKNLEDFFKELKVSYPDFANYLSYDILEQEVKWHLTEDKYNWHARILAVVRFAFETPYVTESQFHWNRFTPIPVVKRNLTPKEYEDQLRSIK